MSEYHHFEYAIALLTFLDTHLHPQPSHFHVRIFRLIRLIVHIIQGILIALLLLPSASPMQRDLHIQRWCRQLLSILNVALYTYGELPTWDTRNTMFVANHISWMDIHALNCVRTIRFIGKSEIKHWPIFGWFATKANTLYIERERRQHTGVIVNTASESLKLGDCMCFFPEGTTTDGSQLMPFKGSLMQAAIDAKADVWPVAIRYPNTDNSINKQMAFADETTLIASIWAVLSLAQPVVELHFLPVIQSNQHERRGLTLMVRNQIAAKLGLKHETP